MTVQKTENLIIPWFNYILVAKVRLLLAGKHDFYTIYKNFPFLLDQNDIKNMLPVNASLQNNRCCFYSFGFFKHELNSYFDFLYN